MSDKIIITKAGFNALTETDDKNKIFDSELNHLKNKFAGSFTQTLASNASYTGTLAHGMSGRPLCMAYFRESGGSQWSIASTEFGLSFPDRKSTEFSVDIYIDAANVYIKARNYYSTTKTIEVQYEVFYENA